MYLCLDVFNKYCLKVHVGKKYIFRKRIHFKSFIVHVQHVYLPVKYIVVLLQPVYSSHSIVYTTVSIFCNSARISRWHADCLFTKETVTKQTVSLTYFSQVGRFVCVLVPQKVFHRPTVIATAS